MSWKDRLLQVLFPRTCPVCGTVLKLPAGWISALKEPGFHGAPSGKDLRRYESILLCPACRQKVSYVSDPCCPRCGRPLDPGKGPLCADCQKKPPVFQRNAALMLHDDTAKKILYDLKFHNKKDNADWVGFAMAVHLGRLLLSFSPDVLLPVPLHKKRFHQRGFNQAQLIAETLSFWMEKLYGIRIPVDASCLLRSKNTSPQRTIETTMRGRNVADAFIVVKREGQSYRSVVLIDDIYTSGSTLNACAKKLTVAGCKQVCCITASIVS